MWISDDFKVLRTKKIRTVQSPHKAERVPKDPHSET